MFIGSAPRCRSSLFEIICALGSGFSTICGRSFTCLADPGFAAFATGCDAFAALVAKRYFELTAAAIKTADPNHLILGCRFAYKPSPGVIDAAGRQCDVISFNCYDPDPSGVIDAYAEAKKPCLIGEFPFRAIDSSLPNTKGAGPLVATQAERATGFLALRYGSAAALNRRWLSLV